MKKMIAAAVATLALAVGAAGGTAYAVTSASTIKPTPVYACEGSGHVVVTFLSSPSANCPSGTKSIVVGAQGVQGPPGPKGDTGAAASASAFGIASVMIDRGTGASAWATYSAALLGSPAGDQAQGAFRFTCPTTAPSNCALSLSARTTADGWQVYPRILMMKQTGSGPESYCEYGDGADNNNSLATLTTTDATVTLGIGGSLDCGAGQAYPANGVASTIEVPNDGSHYDVYTTLVFKKVA